MFWTNLNTTFSHNKMGAKKKEFINYDSEKNLLPDSE